MCISSLVLDLVFILKRFLFATGIFVFFFSAPLVAPAGLTGHNTSASSIRVVWEPVATDDKNIRGIHRGYKVYYKPINTRWPPVLSNVTADKNTTQVQLSNLHKLTKYSIYVVVTTKWDGLPSRTIYVSTDEGSKCWVLR